MKTRIAYPISIQVGRSYISNLYGVEELDEEGVWHVVSIPSKPWYLEIDGVFEDGSSVENITLDEAKEMNLDTFNKNNLKQF